MEESARPSEEERSGSGMASRRLSFVKKEMAPWGMMRMMLSTFPRQKPLMPSFW